MKFAEKQHNNEITDINKVKNLSCFTVDGLDTLIKPSLYNIVMLEGRCSKCGCCYAGWALRFPRNQSCSNCGAALEIYEDGKKVSEGYSPFTAEKHTISPPPNVPTPSKETKDISS